MQQGNFARRAPVAIMLAVGALFVAIPGCAPTPGLPDAALLPNGAGLPRPAINTVLPAGLPQAVPSELRRQAAIPKFNTVAGSVNPGSQPVLELESATNLVVEGVPARWLVVGRKPGWVRVLVPTGRGAVPSADPAAVNHHAVWVRKSEVELEKETHRIEISLAEKRLRVFQGRQDVASFPVGIGVIGRTDTPTGLCAVVAKAVIQTGAKALLTSCQSEKLDGYAGAEWSTIAIHEGDGFDPELGGDVSNGCIRVLSENFWSYLAALPVGTPVIITA